MSEREPEPGSDDELAEWVEEFSSTKTYRPTRLMVEPDELPQGPSGSVMSGPVEQDGEPDEE
ncbi:hypothetical protein [Streptomyces drozdowiczii]|uniref:Uncharacterized protein n=1 Tax=Streptomyces drozdowiczii TaxID=202862 RepID=A0ABY6PSB4_9ACTN|nr:hypothetical protein [Streptomyces drozdowiczii]MCX0245277.1 hypothetical protein [Streptomyces drozdowiczii]UZK55058.1 hypothetical protein NEH16_13770 [Streptomyces drozdowiczii]